MHIPCLRFDMNSHNSDETVQFGKPKDMKCFVLPVSVDLQLRMSGNNAHIKCSYNEVCPKGGEGDVTYVQAAKTHWTCLLSSWHHRTLHRREEDEIKLATFDTIST